ncbi:hypothetical protein [Peribacillus acanthi]|uniref:hypothetical protein n=1 Tax=Peribacillus acanthi TaxID=2171554 RepID=UPI000D3E9A7D|nr:hypothetical protein [Peribacillus acanthi]
MEKRWAVECWGNLGITEVFYTRREAEAYFLSIRKKLDSSKYIITRDSIVDVKDSSNAVYLTNLDELE